MEPISGEASDERGELILDLLACRLFENSIKLGAAFTSTTGVVCELSDVSRSEGIETAYLGK
jgi:hypothetical protein